MLRVRFNKPHDPLLRAIDAVIPDRWIDDRWPQPARQGRWAPLSTSRLVRVHLLVLLKSLGSFNRACRELRHNVDFRRFCRLRMANRPPTAGYLAQWRGSFAVEQWRDLHRHLLKAVALLFVPPVLGLAVVDSTDLPAAVRRMSKKKGLCRWPKEWHRSAPHAGLAAAKAVNPIGSSVSRNTRFAA